MGSAIQNDDIAPVRPRKNRRTKGGKPRIKHGNLAVIGAVGVGLVVLSALCYPFVSQTLNDLFVGSQQPRQLTGAEVQAKQQEALKAYQVPSAQNSSASPPGSRGAANQNWQTQRDVNGLFEIEMAGAITRSVHSTNGVETRAFRTTLKGGDYQLAAMAVPIPRERQNLPARDTINLYPTRPLPGGTPQPEKWITVANHDGKEIEFAYPDGTRSQTWVFCVGGEMVILSSAKSTDRTQADRFIGSLKFLK